MEIKKSYLVILSIFSLIILAVYSTYAMFSVSVETDDFVNLSASNLPLDSHMIEYERITVSAYDSKTIDFNINNNTDSSLYYGAWYEMVQPNVINDSIVIAKSSDSESESFGSIGSNDSKRLKLVVNNDTNSDIIINIGVAYSETSSLNLPTNRELITEVYEACKLMTITKDNSGANAPKLADNMIPVVYDNCQMVWKKADVNGAWYNYDEKVWANAVVVNNSSRSNYLSSEAGTVINESDILAYYVWIPRYKYKVWNINKEIAVDSYDAYNTGIDIVFEQGTATTGSISCNYDFSLDPVDGVVETCSGSNGDYYTHPAFTFGGKQLEGFWFGKFEMSSSDPSLASGGGKTTDLSVRIKPNVRAWTGNPTDNIYLVNRNMQNSGNEYGFSTDSNVVDTHMLKNIEWGAMTYLTHSNYGRCSDGKCSEVMINNNGNYLTGHAARFVDEPKSQKTTLEYNEDVISIDTTGGSEINPTVVNDTNYPWTVNNGIYSSGNSEVDSSTSTLILDFNLTSRGVLSFDYAVSSEKARDELTITLDDNTLVDELTGIDSGYDENNLSYFTTTQLLEAGNHQLKLVYSKNSFGENGFDKAYIKNIKILDNPVIKQTKVAGGQLASTTGNVYGIYDTNGGSLEYVMAKMSYEEGSFVYYKQSAGNNYTYNSSTAKYIDTYAYGDGLSNQEGFNRTRLGDATGEVVLEPGGMGSSATAWYNDEATVVFSFGQWFIRSGSYDSTSTSGLHYFAGTDGSGSSFSSRSCLVVY